MLDSRKVQQLAQRSESAAWKYVTGRRAPLLNTTFLFVMQHLAEIAAVAQALLERQTLSAGEVEALCTLPQQAPWWQIVSLGEPAVVKRPYITVELEMRRRTVAGPIGGSAAPYGTGSGMFSWPKSGE
jgi:hypothetical protein